MVNTFLTLIEKFDPASNERFRECRLHVVDEFKYPYSPALETAYELAWLPYVDIFNTTSHPLAIENRSYLMPRVWITPDKRLVVDTEDYDTSRRWPRLHMYVALDSLLASDLGLLEDGLSGDFDRIDKEFKALQQKAITQKIDDAVRKIQKERERDPQQPELRIEDLLDPDINREAYEALRGRVVDSIIR